MMALVTVLLLAAGLLAGCKHEEPSVQTEIAVQTNLTPMIKRVGTSGQASSYARANTIDSNSELQDYDVRIDAYFNDTATKYIDGAKLVYNASAWKFWEGTPGAQVHYYWPFEGSVYEPAEGDPIAVTSLDFVGFCPYTKPNYVTSTGYNAATHTASMTCDVSNYMTLARQKGEVDPIPEMQEYLMAVLPSQTYGTQTTAGGALPLVFKHPFALVKFVINAASGTHVKINRICIAELHTGGTCTYDGTTMTWDNYSVETDSMKIVQTLSRKDGGATETSPAFVVIPKSYGKKYLTVNATWDEWSNVTISDYGTDVDINWEPGRSYTYNLTLDQYGLTVDAGKYTEQW